MEAAVSAYDCQWIKVAPFCELSPVEVIRGEDVSILRVSRFSVFAVEVCRARGGGVVPCVEFSDTDGFGFSVALGVIGVEGHAITSRLD